MSPGNDQRRPGQGSGVEKVIAATDTIVTPSADLCSRDVLIAEIMALGPDALFAASLGWRLGRLDAEEIAKQRIAAAGWEVASSPEWRATSRQPRWAELQRHRGECVHRHRPVRCGCTEPRDSAR